MSAYSRSIKPRECNVCGKTATCEVYDDRQFLRGFYCAEHGQKRINELNRESEAYDRTTA